MRYQLQSDGPVQGRSSSRGQVWPQANTGRSTDVLVGPAARDGHFHSSESCTRAGSSTGLSRGIWEMLL